MPTSELARSSFEEAIQLTLEAWIADPAEPDDVRARALNAWATLESFEGTAPDSVRTMAEPLPGGSGLCSGRVW